MNNALNALKEANPNLYAEFIERLTEDLGLGDTSASAIRCPNCQAQIQVTLSQTTGARPGRTTTRGRRGSRKAVRPRRQWNPKPNSLFNLLVRVAKIRRTTTGGVSAEFNKSMRTKIKGMSPAEVREIKIKWLNEQISKAGRSRQAA